MTTEQLTDSGWFLFHWESIHHSNYDVSTFICYSLFMFFGISWEFSYLRGGSYWKVAFLSFFYNTLIKLVEGNSIVFCLLWVRINPIGCFTSWLRCHILFIYFLLLWLHKKMAVLNLFNRRFHWMTATLLIMNMMN